MKIRDVTLALHPEWIAINKPWRYAVHPPEDRRYKIHPMFNLLARTRDALKSYVYPVHRLDRAATGVLLFARTKEMASEFGRAFRGTHESSTSDILAPPHTERSEISSKRTQQPPDTLPMIQVNKTYICLVRGHPPDSGTVNDSLKRENGTMAPAITHYCNLQKIEVPFAIGPRYSSARYSLLQVKTETGTYHQIRRHMNSIGYPILGDKQHGDRDHNRFFATRFGTEGLFLHAQKLEIFPLTAGPNVGLHAPLFSHAHWWALEQDAEFPLDLTPLEPNV